MKRYDLEDTGTPGQPELIMVEGADGEWVKHKDVMCEIPIESMKRMRLKNGDAIVLKHPGILFDAEYQSIRNTMFAVFKKLGIDQDTPVCILEDGMDVEIISKENLNAVVPLPNGKTIPVEI